MDLAIMKSIKQQNKFRKKSNITKIVIQFCQTLKTALIAIKAHSMHLRFARLLFCFYSGKHVVFMSKNKDWSAQSQNNVSWHVIT